MRQIWQNRRNWKYYSKNWYVKTHLGQVVDHAALHLSALNGVTILCCQKIGPLVTSYFLFDLFFFHLVKSGLYGNYYGGRLIFFEAHSAFFSFSKSGVLFVYWQFVIGVFFDKKTYQLLVEAMAKTGEVDKAVQMLEKMKTDKLFTSEYSYKTIIQGT